MASNEIPPELLAVAQQLSELHERARELGIFIDDRELLNCVSCGLQEDITIEGRLITHDSEFVDLSNSGLRFQQLDDGRFCCPRCGAHLDAGDTGAGIEALQGTEEATAAGLG